MIRLPWTTRGDYGSGGPQDEPPDGLDRELARGMAEGSREDTGRFVGRHLGPLHSYLARRLGPGHEAAIEEICRATFADAARRIRRYAGGRPRLSGRLWLVRLAERHVSRKLRGARREALPGEAEKGTIPWLQEALAAMPRQQQAALSLALFERLSPEEIAAATGATPARSMRRLRAALLQVSRRILGE